MSSSDPPADLDAERKLLGAILLQPSMLDELLGEVSPADFFYAGNGSIYGAMVDLAIENKPVSTGTVARALDSKLLKDLGGSAGLTALLEGALPSEASYYAEVIVNKRKKRNLLTAADKARELALSNSDPNKDYNEISELLAIGLDGRGNETIGMAQGADIFLERFNRLIELPGALAGPSTGFDKLDQLLDGLRPGGVTTVYARTNDYKSMFVANVGYNLAGDGASGLWYTTESPNYEVMERLAQFESQLNIRELKFTGKLGEFQDRIREAVEIVRGYPIWINTKSSLDLGFVSATTRQLNKQHKLSYIIVDLVDKVGSKKFETDTRNSAHVMEQMKQLAKQEDLHVLLTTHVRKGDKFADWSKPYIDLDEMKDTSAKGQDSDAAISLVPVKESDNTWGWEALKWEERVERERLGKVGLYVSVQKNRHGPRGHFVLEIDLTRGGIMDNMVVEKDKWPS